MKRFAFNHDLDTTSEALGISDEGQKRLHEAVMSTAFKAVITDHAIDCPSKALERLINEGQPANVVEAMLLGYLYGKAEMKFAEVANKIAASMP